MTITARDTSRFFRARGGWLVQVVGFDPDADGCGCGCVPPLAVKAIHFRPGSGPKAHWHYADGHWRLNPMGESRAHANDLTTRVDL